MSRNGSGVYNLPVGNPVTTGTTISSTWANNTLSDIATALTGSLAADGQTVLTGNLQAGGNKLTGIAAGTVPGDAVELSQFNTPTFTGNVTMLSTGFLLIPAGTTAQRPVSPVAGEIRFNTDLGRYEGFDGSVWTGIGGGATGGGSDQIFIENGQTVTISYTIPTLQNAMSTGPISINSGVTVTVPDGSVWVVL